MSKEIRITDMDTLLLLLLFLTNTYKIQALHWSTLIIQNNGVYGLRLIESLPDEKSVNTVTLKVMQNLSF